MTASKMKAVCHTGSPIPPQDLFATQQLSNLVARPHHGDADMKNLHGICISNKKRNNHNDFEINDSGLVINSMWPHLGASPDATINSTCCSKGPVEVKCSYMFITIRSRLRSLCVVWSSATSFCVLFQKTINQKYFVNVF